MMSPIQVIGWVTLVIVLVASGNIFELPKPPEDVTGDPKESIGQYHDYYQEYNAKQPEKEKKETSPILWYFIKTIGFIVIIIALLCAIIISTIYIYDTLLGHNRLASLREEVMKQLPPGQGYDESGKLIRYRPLRREVKAYDKLMKTLHSMSE